MRVFHTPSVAVSSYTVTTYTVTTTATIPWRNTMFMKAAAAFAAWLVIAFTFHLISRVEATEARVDVRSFGAVCNGSNIKSALDAALASGALRVYVPSGCVYTAPSRTGANLTLPANMTIEGDGPTTVFNMCPSGAGACTNFIVATAPWGALQGISLTDQNGGPFDIGYIVMPLLDSGISTPATAGNSGAFFVTKSGASGNFNVSGIAVAHTGLGTGDNYWSGLTSNTSQFVDALYRGDLCGDVAPGNPCSTNLGAAAVILSDTRTGNYGQPPVWYHTYGATNVSADSGLVRFSQNTSHFSGTILKLAGAYGAGTFDGYFLRLQNGGGYVLSIKANGCLVFPNGSEQCVAYPGP